MCQSARVFLEGIRESLCQTELFRQCVCVCQRERVFRWCVCVRECVAGVCVCVCGGWVGVWAGVWVVCVRVCGGGEGVWVGGWVVGER